MRNQIISLCLTSLLIVCYLNLISKNDTIYIHTESADEWYQKHKYSPTDPDQSVDQLLKDMDFICKRR